MAVENNNYRLNSPIELDYSVEELSKLKYVKIIYKGVDNKFYEIGAKVKFIGEHLISLYFKQSKDFNIKYPQELIIKFITDDFMYLTKAMLKDAKKSAGLVFFTIIPPEKMLKQQNRKFCRVDLDRVCLLVITKSDGKSATYLSRSVNISANGILIYKLESLIKDEFIEMEMSKEDRYNIVIFFEPDLIMKHHAIFIRQEQKNDLNRYAFQFFNMKQVNIDTLCKYVASEQLKQLKHAKKHKNRDLIL